MLSEEVLHPHLNLLLHPLLPRPVKLDSNGDKPPPEPPNLENMDIIDIFLRGQKRKREFTKPQMGPSGTYVSGNLVPVEN